MFSVVAAFVTDGPLNVTVIAAVAIEPPNPAVVALVDSWTSKLPVVNDPVVGVNFRPAAPWAKVMKLPVVIGVVPLFWYSVPPLTAVIWK